MKIPVKEYIKLLSKYLRPLWLQVLLLGLLVACSIAFQLINPQIIRFFIDAVSSNSAEDKLIYAAILFIGIAALQQVFAILATYISQNVGWISTNELRCELVEHCLNLDMTFHKEHQPGEIIQRVDADVTSLFNFFSKFSVNLLTNMGLIIGALIMMFSIDWKLGGAITLFCCLSIFAFGRIQGVAVPYNMKDKEISAKFYGFLGEQIACTEDARSNGAAANIMNNFYLLLRKWRSITLKSKFLGYSVWMTAEGVFALGNFAGLGIGAYLWKKGVITIGAVYVIFKYMDLIIRPLEQIRRQFQDLQDAGASIIRVKELLAMESKIKDCAGEFLYSGALSVNMNNVCFEYEKNMPVLNNVSLNIPKGRVLGILGRTGSGKTTLVRLLIRFYDPMEGEIRLDDTLINKIPLKDLRSQIAYVTQEVQLFQGTIRDNLTFFNRSISDCELLNAIEGVGLKRWYESLPDGLDTMLNAEGGGLSAGEAQLLAFVRAFLKNPGLIILDEASSRLDPATEKFVEEAVSKLLEGRTGVIIAHRLKTIQRADDILILENGAVSEYGSRRKLAEDIGSHFYSLLQSGMEEVLI